MVWELNSGFVESIVSERARAKTKQALTINAPGSAVLRFTMVFCVFALCFFTLLLSLYIFCVLSGAVYFGIKLKKGHLSKQEYINIVFKGVYPKHWQKGL